MDLISRGHGQSTQRRLDEALVAQGRVSSRTRAQALIRSGAVSVDGRVVDRPGARVAVDAALELAHPESPWVSRGAEKLLSALDRFGIDPEGKTCLDIGSSTGGFTQVLLARGARQVVAVDVGTEQMAPTLRSDPRVDLREGTHVLHLTREEIPGNISLIVADLSFISLAKVLPKLAEIAAPGIDAIVLVKPQFEVGKDAIKKGIVRDVELRELALQDVLAAAERSGFTVRGTMDSPIEGSEGNREYLAHLTRNIA